MEVNNVNLSYKATQLDIQYFMRSGGDIVLLYLHGGACSKSDFIEATTVPELDDYTIISFDYPGCGNSPYTPHRNLDVDDLAEITQIFIEQLQLNNIVLVGHSMGGLVAMLYMLKHKSALAFISIEGNLAPENCIFSRKVANTADFSEFKSKGFPALRKSLEESDNTGFRKWSKAVAKSSALAFYNYCPSLVHHSDSGVILKHYIDLDIPTLYIYGSENANDLNFLRTLNTHGCKNAEISNSNHFPFFDNPTEFYQVICNFMEEIDWLR